MKHFLERHGASRENTISTFDRIIFKPCPHRRFARLWIKCRPRAAEIDETCAAAMTRDGIESPDAPSPTPRLPEYGMRIHGEYTMYGCFFFLKRLLGNVQKWRFFLDRDAGLRAACLAAFRNEIKDRTADAFYAGIAKDLTVDEKRQKWLEAKARFAHAEAAHPTMKPKEVKPMLINERLKSPQPTLQAQPRQRMAHRSTRHGIQVNGGF